MLWRALRLRCPVCGAKPIFARWGEMVERCPRCAYSFEREEGYWVGAMIVNLGVAQALFLAILLGGVIATRPDIPWPALTVASLGTMLAWPIWFYPRSKTLWIWLDLLVHPYTPEERPHPVEPDR